MKNTIVERIAEAVADALLLKLEYNPYENDRDYLVEARKNLDAICKAYRNIGASIRIDGSVVTVNLDGNRATVDADEL